MSADPQEEAETEATDAAAKKAAGGGSSAKIGDRFRIDFSKPLKAWHIPGAKAYQASDDKVKSKNVLAWVMEPKTAYRTKPMKELTGKPCPHVVPIEYSGVVVGPGSGEKTVAVIADRPEGGKLGGGIKNVGTPMSERDVIEFILPQLLSGLDNLHSRGVAHRALRPANLWFMDRDRQTIALGDCICSPPGKYQPKLFETIERAMSNPDGRGFGNTSDDLYALGVTLYSLLNGGDPRNGRTDDQILASKVAMGSFVAIVGESKWTPSVTGMLRGLLTDDADDRWTVDTVRAWRDGAVIKTKRSLPDRRAEGAINFLGHEYMYRRILAGALAKYPEDAMAFANGGKLEVWLRRGLDAGKTADELSFLISGAGSGGATDVLNVTQMSFVLDPLGPMRYRNISFMWDGLGPVLARAYVDRDEEVLEAIRTILHRGMLSKWADMRRVLTFRNAPGHELFERLHRFFRDVELGSGIERILYELNPALPCLSPKVADESCLNPRTLLRELDRLAAKDKDNSSLVDRHIAAFLCAKSKKIEEAFVNFNRSNRDSESGIDLGPLALLAVTQREAGVGALPGLSAWAVHNLGGAINNFRSRARRDEVQGRLAREVRKGDLGRILDLLGAPRARREDENEFQDAVSRFATMELEINALEMDEKTRQALAVRVGHRIAYFTAMAAFVASIAYSLFSA